MCPVASIQAPQKARRALIGFGTGPLGLNSATLLSPQWNAEHATHLLCLASGLAASIQQVDIFILLVIYSNLIKFSERSSVAPTKRPTFQTLAVLQRRLLLTFVSHVAFLSVASETF